MSKRPGGECPNGEPPNGEPSPDHERPDHEKPDHETPGHVTLVDEMRALVGEAQAMARTEIAYQTARLSLGGRLVGRVAGLGALALALVFFALMALVVGCLLALIPLLGAWGAVAVVVVALLLATFAALLGMRAGWRRLRELFKGQDSAP